MRDLLLVSVFFPMLPFAFMYPWIGILVWSWISYMNPHRLTFGFAYDMPLGMIAALTTLAGFLFSRERKRLPRAPEVILLLAMWAWVTITSFFAIHTDLAWDKWQQVGKILLMALATMMLCRDAGRLRYLAWTIAASLGFYGVKSGIDAILSGFSGGFSYPGDSFIGDSNDLALALDMTLPLLWFMVRAETRRWARYALHIAFGLTVLGILTTYSRGGFIGLCVVLIFLFTRARAKALSLGVLLLAGVLAAFVVPETFFSRIGTIASYEQDQSAQARLKAWTLATQIALDSPIFGGGFRVFEQDVWDQYFPGTERAIVAHSIYFQTLAEHGFVGLGIFAALLVATYLGLRRVRRRATDTDQTIVANLAAALQASLVGYMVAGAFLSRADFDLFYSVVAMSAAMQAILASLPGREGESAASRPDATVGVDTVRPMSGSPR
ncbi:MAG: putative O-glycosylation ligase, exosortase A system-associated [Candidatus Rokubacteria bacterium 13_1_40CM_68_15]|nr:MAG: putative O-glycosylation ligase, exosortase A system-associated [Candidatus Rokubacteria bacterium 13_1_40CM_68_15]